MYREQYGEYEYVHLYSFQPQLQATFQQLMYFLVQFTSVVFMILM